jgi:hypothetical protein
MRLWLGALMALPVVTSACDRRDPTRSTAPVSASSSSAPAPLPSPSADAASSIHCQSDPSFPAMLDVPEASGAAEVELRKGVREILVVADSGRKGAALAYEIPNGPARRLTLPLDRNVTDDVEGLAWWSGHLYAIVSTGWVERFAPDGKGGVVRDRDADALGPPPFTAGHPTYAWGQPPDFEGLCLRPSTSAKTRCAGYAASRSYGWLVCLVFEGEHLRVNPTHPRLTLDVNEHSLSDCAFGAADGPAQGDLLVTTNVRGGSTVYRVDEETGALTPISVEPTLNNEAIAVDHEGRLYQMMDGNADRSAALRDTCSGW